MATFIKLHTEQVEQPDGSVKIKRRMYTDKELAELRVSHPSLFISVPESHAADVIRPQGLYQEVEDVQAEDNRADDTVEDAVVEDRKGKRGGQKPQRRATAKPAGSRS